MSTRRIGIVGYGNLGKYLVQKINDDPSMELVFVWNRSADKVREDKATVPESAVLEDLSQFESRNADLIVEVAHPAVVAEWGEKFITATNLMVGSPTALADADVEKKLRNAADQTKHSLFIPSGALWGGEDIKKMAMTGALTSLTITMKKHPASLKVLEPLTEKLKKYQELTEETGECVVYEGAVRALCPLAPNNVNTMACAALAAQNLGMDKVQARLIADKSLKAHVIEIVASGPENADGEALKISTTRYNPAATGAVTGNATYNSFHASLLQAHSRGAGLHFC